jgi:signal transduction histidine kinase
LSRSIATGEPVTNEEIEVVRGDGSRGTLSVSSTAIRDSRGRVVAGVMVDLDITERKRAAAELERLTSVAQRRAAELQAVFDTMVDGVFVCDAEGQLTIINPAGESMMKLVATLQGTEPQAGLAAFAGMRRPDGSLVGYENLPIVRALAGNVVLLDDAVCTPPGGPTVYLRTSAAPIRDQAGQIVGAVAVVRDVTELLELDRLKDQFLNLAAHELKTPLAIMKGYAQILLRQPGAVPDANRRMLEAINRGTDRISGVVNDLLDVAQLEQGQLKLEKENVDLAALVEQVVNEMSLIAPNHRLRVIRSEPVVIKGDRYRLRQVINHLVENAVRFSPKGGDIDLAVDVRGPEAVVSVEDHGVGIPKGKQPRLFQRFYRAHADTPHDYGGIGIGLYIAKEVVLRHGGRMWFESEEGKGSTFYFALPLAGEGISQVDA